jgi:putative membrane protein
MERKGLFDDESLARVKSAVQEAEARSRGQIVPVVVEKSDAYPEARFRGALLGGAVATSLVILLELPLTLVELPFVQVVAGLLGGLLATWDPLERLLVGPKSMDEAVRARAAQAFQEQGLHRTREGTGVLVFASLFEHEAVILGDHGIHARMGEAGWEGALQALVAGLRRGAPADGFVEAVARVGATLAEHFPRQAGDGPPANELADGLRVQRT